MTWTKKSNESLGARPNRKEAIAAFWAFWPTVAQEVATSIGEQGMSEPLIQAMNEHVRAIDPSLDWELGPGRGSQHHLCLSAKGDPILRIVAEAWLRAAPPPDATWEYYASRQPHGCAGLVLEIGGHKLELDALACGVTEDDSREVLDLIVHHPEFASMADTNLQAQVMFIGLDTLLGEDDVERWLGVLETSSGPPPGALPLGDLPDRIRKFAARCTGERWTVLRGTKEGRPIYVSRNCAIKRIDHLLLDTHIEVAIRLADPTEEGLTTTEEAEVLNLMEDQLGEALGEDAVYLGRETHAGFRTLHLHVMESGPAAAKLHAWRERHGSYAIELTVHRDPRWEVLARWD